MELAEDLRGTIKGEVLVDPADLDFYSHDTSLFEVKPQVIVFPKDTEDVKKLVTFVSTHKKDSPTLSLTARSAGTDMTGGAINDSIIVEFNKYFNRIGEINLQNTTVEPGVYYRDFEKKTLAQNLLLPSYPASKNICALGGMVNNNSGGEKSLTYGKTIDYVNDLKVVLADGNEYEFKKIDKGELEKKIKQENFEGEVYRRVFKIVEENYDLVKNAKPKVTKDSTGYNIWDVWDKQNFDLTKLFVGSQGTLGLTTEINLRLVEAKKYSGLLVIYLEEIDKLPHLITTVVATKPDSFEAFDDHTLGLALRFIPQFAKMLGFAETIGMGLQFLPQLVNFAFHGIPKFTLLVEYEADTQEEVNTRVENLKKEIDPYKLKSVLAETKKQSDRYWLIRRESFNILRKTVKDKHTAPFIDDFVISPEYIKDYFPRLLKILEKYDLKYTITGHMGDGNFHIIPFMDLANPADRAKIDPCAEDIYDLVFEFKGSTSGEHNEGLSRGPYVKKMYGEKMFSIFKEIKDIFDSENIFNPHKKVDADLQYSLSHIRSHY